MQVTAVETLTKPFSSASWLDRRRVATPMSAFPEFAASRSSWRGPGADLVWVLIRTEDPDVFGVGQARGGRVTAALVEHHLAGLLVGRSATDIARRVAELNRAVLPYAAGAMAAMGVGAVELALWDLSARALGTPLVGLLGGSHAELPYYLTVSDPAQLVDVDPALLAGAMTVKVSMPAAVVDGPQGLAENLGVVERVRAVLPAGVSISVDCFMSWSVPYAVRFAADGAELGLGWIEEPLRPDDLSGYRELRERILPVMVAGGEHVHGLRAGLDLVESRSVDVVQVDVTWCGGIAVAQTVGRAALERDLLFAPHAALLQPWAVHLLGALGPGIVTEILLGVDGSAQVPRPSTSPGVGIDPVEVGFTP